MKKETTTDKEIREAIKILKRNKISDANMKFFTYCKTHDVVHLLKKENGCVPCFIEIIKK